MPKRPDQMELRVYLPAELHTEFKVLCVRKHISMSSLVSEWVEDWVEAMHQEEEKQRKQKPRRPGRGNK